jgi:hypothetical protein
MYINAISVEGEPVLVLYPGGSAGVGVPDGSGVLRQNHEFSLGSGTGDWWNE